jgi:hypothetical protein
MASAQLALADFLVDRADPGPALAAARGYLDRANKVNPSHMMSWFYRAVAARYEARARLNHGGDVVAAVTEGRAALDQALKLAPGSADAWVERARLDLIESQARPGDATALSRARADADKAIALDGQFAEARLTAAEACLELAKKTHSADAVRRGLAYADGAIAINPKLEEAKKVRAALVLEGGRN